MGVFSERNRMYALHFNYDRYNELILPVKLQARQVFASQVEHHRQRSNPVKIDQ